MFIIISVILLNTVMYNWLENSWTGEKPGKVMQMSLIGYSTCNPNYMMIHNCYIGPPLF